MKGGCDYSALAKVDAQLQELLNGRLDAIIDEKSSEAAAALLSKLKKRTPVGKAPHFDEPMTVTIKGDDYTTQTVNKKGEQVFRKRKGKTYRFRSKSGSTPLTGGTNGTVEDGNYQTFLDAVESRTFNALGCTSANDTIKKLFAAFTERMRWMKR